MSADPFRDIVKQYAHLYRESEEARIASFEKKSKEYLEWKKQNEVYLKALEAFRITAKYNEDQSLQRSNR